MHKILVFVGGFPPGYKFGGPGRSVYNLVNTLRRDFDFSIVTSDRDIGDNAAYPNIPADQWIDAFGVRLRYCSPERMNLRFAEKLVRETPHDLLYLNSFFATRFAIAPLLARRLGVLPRVPTVVAPRGEFSDGALMLKHFKKRIYMEAGKTLGLFDGLNWHASSSLEMVDIKKAIGAAECDISIASNLAAPLADNPPPHLSREPGAPLRVIFLSRISPKKNLVYALEVLSGIELPVSLSIIGPEEDAAYASQCRAIIARLPGTIKVEWIGSLPPEKVPQAMSDHDLFFLPTLGENFGHVIAEALGAGTPVLLSDTTPWRGLEKLGVGHDLPLSEMERFRDALRDAWHQNQSDAARMRHRAASYARERQRGGADVEANRDLFRRALSGR